MIRRAVQVEESLQGESEGAAGGILNYSTPCDVGSHLFLLGAAQHRQDSRSLGVWSHPPEVTVGVVTEACRARHLGWTLYPTEGIPCVQPKLRQASNPCLSLHRAGWHGTPREPLPSGIPQALQEQNAASGASDAGLLA